MRGKVSPALALVMAGLKVKRQAKAKNEQYLAKLEPKPTPMAELLADAVPPLTDFEQAQRESESLLQGKPAWDRRGPDPRKVYLPKGAVSWEPISQITEGPKTFDEAQAHKGRATPGQPQGVQERLRYNAAKAKAAQGKRLTKADKKIMGKYDLHLARRIAGVAEDSEVMAGIVAGLRPKQSD